MKTFIKSIAILSLVLFTWYQSCSQTTSEKKAEKCGSDLLHKWRLINEPGYAATYENLQNYVNDFVAKHPNGFSPKAIINIPVVFHEVLSAIEQSIFPDSRIDEQIIMLNRDFSGQNPHSMYSFPANLKADVNIQFYKATIDTNGNPTNGIEKVTYSGANWDAGDNGLKQTISGGLDAWNTSQYFNVWICNLTSGMTGYATYPTVINSYYGLAIDYEYTGSTGATPPLNEGGTAAHETGHCFNLPHIWGDSPGCSLDDGINDTPTQDYATFGNPTWPFYDACTSTGNGIMFMNFMDYTDDIGYANFTPAQKTVMLACFAPGGPLETLGQTQFSCNANAGLDDNACGQTYILQGNISQIGSTALWTSSNPNVIFSDSSQITTTVTIPSYSNPSVSYIFTLTETNTSIPCTASDTVVITFIKPPHAEAGNYQSVCGTFAQVLADTIGSGLTSGYWTVNPAGPQITQMFPYAATIDISNLGSNAFNNQSMAEYYMLFVATNNQGCSSVDSFQITFYEIPTANAGLDTSVCGKTFDLAGNWSITNHAGLWSYVSGGSASFAQITNPVSSVTVTNYGLYLFIWKEINLGNPTCFDRDTITVNFLTGPMPDAGLDISVCGKFAHICADTTVSGGSWSCPQGGIGYYDAPIDSISHYNPSFKDSACTWIRWGSENGTAILFWSEFNGVCFGYDSVNVYFGYTSPAISLVNPADSVVCGPTYYLLNAQQPAFGYGFWIDTVQNTVFSPSSDITNPIATIDTGGVALWGWHSFYWITVNGQCRDTSAVVKVLFKTNVFTGIAQSSLVSDFSDFKAEIFSEISYINTPIFSDNLTSNGNFSLWAEPNKNYYLKISSNIPQLYPTIADTYYDSTYNWQDATILTTLNNCDTINVNVPLATYTSATGGQCRIYGLVRYDGSLAPVQNAMVYLRYQPNQDLARFEYTNLNGYYSINNIATGNYKLFVDIPGLPQITNHHIIVNPNDTVFADVNFIVDTTSISKDYGFGIYADTTGFINVPLNNNENLQVSVFPNPFNQQLTLSANLSKTENISAEIFDNLGKLILGYPEKQYVSGDFKLVFPTSKLNYGVYFLKVSIGNSVYIKKITKQ